MQYKIFFTLTLAFLALAMACKGKAPAAQANIAFDNDIDYACGMKVQPEFTDTLHYNGKVFGFCSESCKDEFKANPESFLNNKAGN